jgi:hypothetical protein
MSWSVSKVVHERGDELGHGFSVIDQHRVPLLTLIYKTSAEAELAYAVFGALLAQAIDVISHSHHEH